MAPPPSENPSDENKPAKKKPAKKKLDETTSRTYSGTVREFKALEKAAKRRGMLNSHFVHAAVAYFIENSTADDFPSPAVHDDHSDNNINDNINDQLNEIKSLLLEMHNKDLTTIASLMFEMRDNHLDGINSSLSEILDHLNDADESESTLGPDTAKQLDQIYKIATFLYKRITPELPLREHDHDLPKEVADLPTLEAVRLISAFLYNIAPPDKKFKKAFDDARKKTNSNVS